MNNNSIATKRHTPSIKNGILVHKNKNLALTPTISNLPNNMEKLYEAKSNICSNKKELSELWPGNWKEKDTHGTILGKAFREICSKDRAIIIEKNQSNNHLTYRKEQISY